MSNLLTDKQRRQLELCGIEPEQRQLPTPIWMQAFSSAIVKAVAVLALLILGANIAEWTVRREHELQQQQKTILRSIK